jgi:hypothetical protein
MDAEEDIPFKQFPKSKKEKLQCSILTGENTNL